MLNKDEFNLSKEELINDPINWAVKHRDKFWKEKIQNVERRLKEELKVHERVNPLIVKRIDKIFLEEIGEGILEREIHTREEVEKAKQNAKQLNKKAKKIIKEAKELFY